MSVLALIHDTRYRSAARRRRTAGWSLSALALVGAALGCGRDEPTAPDAGITSVEFAPGQGSVHGYVDAQISSGNAFGLPDATLRLKRLSDSAMTPPVTTDVHGAFIASNVPTGTYVICLSGTPGFANACTPASFAVQAGKIAYPAHAAFSPQRVAAWGRVRLGDGSDVRYENSLFGKEVNVFVKAMTTGGALAAGPVRANSRGQYVLRQLSPGTAYHLVAQAENTTVDLPATTGTAPLNKDFTLPNRKPVVDEVTAMQDGHGARHVEAGSVVTVIARASDPDGHALHYKWLAPGGSCATTDAATVDCTMPAVQGVQSIYVQVSDGHGEYAVGRVRVAVGPAISMFTGKVVTDGGVAVPGAEVRVNGVATTSTAAGGFSITVPEQNRYTLTIKKDGFQMISKVYLAEVMGVTYRLLKDEHSVIDPTKDNTVLVHVPKTDTGGQNGYQDITVKLPAGSIIDAAGNKVTGPVTVYRSRFDHLFDPYDRMPGDYGARNTSGDDVTLTSFGALEVNLRGPAGEKYNLAPGMPSDVTYPIHASQLAAAPATIALWYYNEGTGIWDEDGVATLQTVNGVKAYVGQAKHFTAVNVDLQKKDATCLKLVVDQTTLSVPFYIRVAVPGFPVRDRLVEDNVTAIVRLPPNVTGAQLWVLDDNNQPINNSVRNFDTGEVVAAGTNLDLGPPFNECITPPSPPVTLALDLPQNPNPFWLTKAINPGANDAERSAYGDAYYAAIQAEATLGAWKSRNQFTGTDDAEAYYLNAGDLEFGRSMHMKKHADGSIAYYVTNFANADKAFGGNDADVIATVAMEYSKYPSNVAGAPLFTKFYVFDKGGNLVNKAELDNRGDKYVPGLCVVCHGGTTPANIAGASPPGNTDSRFIPFDLKSFDSSPLLPGYPALLPRNQQEENFRKLNQGVHDQTGATDAQKALIEAWYPGGVGAGGQTQQDGLANIPFFWATSADPDDAPFYYDVIRPSCRACHNSRPSIDFGSPATFPKSLAFFAVCQAGYMPQSFVAWRNLWHSQSPHQPTRMEQYTGMGACLGPQ